MAEPIGALRAELSAGHAQFAADMKKAKDAVTKNAHSMQAAMDKVGKKFNEAAVAINKYAGLALAGAAVAAAAFVKKQIDVADQMGKLAQSTGTTSEFLSSMALVASQGGTTLEVVAKGVKKLSQNMYDVSKGIGEAKDAFEDLNIQVKNSDGSLKDSEEIFKDIADRFKKIEDGAQKTAYAMDIFGKAGADLIPMLNGGREGIEQLQKKAEELGLVISTKTALDAAYLNDQLDILTKTAVGFGRGLALNVIPWLNEAMATIKLAKEESGTLMAAWVALGSIGSAVFEKSLQGRISETRKDLMSLIKYNAQHPGARQSIKQKNDQEIKRLQAQLTELEAQKEKQDKAEEAHKKASLDRMREEADQRRKNTEAIIKQSEERLKREKEQAELESRTKAAREKAADDELNQWKELWTAKEDYEKDASERNKEFQDEYKRATLSTVQYELSKLKERYEYYAEHVNNKKALDEWYRSEKEKLIEKEVKTVNDAVDELKRAIDGFGRDSAKAIVDFCLTGEQSFSDMINSMISDLLTMMVYQNMTKPLASALGSFNFGSLLGSAKGNAFSHGNLIPYAKGGVVTQPTVFPMAHGAGLMGEAGAEAILPLTRIGGDLGVKATSGETKINIYNNVGASVKTQSRQTPQGPEIDVLIDRAVAQKLGKFGSQSNKAMRTNFGAKDRLVSR